MIDRSHVNKCLSKAIAYKNVGKDNEAAHWARKLIIALELAEILDRSHSDGWGLSEEFSIQHWR